MGAGEKKNLTEHFACGGTWGRVCIQGGGLGALPQKILKSRTGFIQPYLTKIQGHFQDFPGQFSRISRASVHLFDTLEWQQQKLFPYCFEPVHETAIVNVLNAIFSRTFQDLCLFLRTFQCLKKFSWKSRTFQDFQGSYEPCLWQSPNLIGAPWENQKISIEVWTWPKLDFLHIWTIEASLWKISKPGVFRPSHPFNHGNWPLVTRGRRRAKWQFWVLDFHNIHRNISIWSPFMIVICLYMVNNTS